MRIYIVVEIVTPRVRGVFTDVRKAKASKERAERAGYGCIIQSALLNKELG